MDFRKLNDSTIKDAYPMPNQAQLFDVLRGNKFFTSIDLASGYWQVPVAAEHRHQTPICDHRLRLVWVCWNANWPGQCTCNLSTTYAMNELLQQHLYQANLIFLDDILTYSKTAEDHLKHLEEVFVTIRNAKLKLKPKKSQLLQRHVVYIGHVIGVGGTSPDP